MFEEKNVPITVDGHNFRDSMQVGWYKKQSQKGQLHG